MPNFKESFASGKSFERLIESVVRSYTRYVFTNVDIPTLYTEKGYTESDIIAVLGNIIVVIEAKNIRKLEGDLKSDYLYYTSNNGQRYSSLSPFTQNRIHQFSISDEYRKRFGEWPMVLPAVVVPATCVIDPRLESEPSLVTLDYLSDQIAEIARIGGDSRDVCLRVDCLVEKWKGMNMRG